MTRELKFRAWDEGNDRYIEHFDFVRYSDGTLGVSDSSEPFNRFGETSLEQFTGLKDKNGTDIYEGDIIKAKHDDGRYDTGEVVYGRKGAFCLSLPNVATGIKTPLLNYIFGMMFDEYDFEVIGNVHENPELLEGSES